ncbi:MAG: TIGR04282 family arsenosugar biosynthesis glycosyltransferase [Actinomycetes bacterium]
MSGPLAPTRGTAAPPTLVVLAKAPVPGAVKTRLTPPLSPARAADLAAAALLDTLDAVARAARALGGPRPVLALAGDPRDAVRAAALRRSRWSFTVVRQRGTGLDERIAAAHRDASALHPAHGTLQVGMDTPQVTAERLVCAAGRLASPGVDAVLGLAEDGGWWALGLRDPRTGDAVRGVPMSREDTGALTRASLTAWGAVPVLLPTARDVDTWDDARAVAAAHPSGRFGATVRELAAPVTQARPHTRTGVLS